MKEKVIKIDREKERDGREERLHYRKPECIDDEGQAWPEEKIGGKRTGEKNRYQRISPPACDGSR